MSVFGDREKAFENKFAHDEELRFKAIARRNRLFGELIGGRLDKTGDALDAYAKEVVVADLEEPGDADILRKVTADLEAAGIAMTQEDLQAELAMCLEKVMADLAD